jgi:protein-tyrosine-phosphatase
VGGHGFSRAAQSSALEKAPARAPPPASATTTVTPALDTQIDWQYCSLFPHRAPGFSFEIDEVTMHKLLLLPMLLLPLAIAQQAPDNADKPRVFITDSQSWEYVSNAGGGGGAFASHGSGGARPQTAEIIKTFSERCPQTITNNKLEKSDYVVVLDHEGGKGVLRHRNKVAVFNRISGDSIVSKSTLSLGGSVQDACEAITRDWSAHAKDIRAAEAAASTTADPKLVPAAATATGSSVPPPIAPQQAQLQIYSTPDGADIEIDGNYIGNTPSTVGATPGQHQVSIKKSGFKPWERKITVSTGQINVNASLEPEPK